MRFLHSLQEQKAATHLFLVGDIFDLWIGNHQHFILKFAPIVNAIAALKDAGVEVIYFEGNHDMHIQELWQKNFDIPVFVNPKIFSLGPWKVRVEHGDFINPNDKAYERYRSVVRHPFMEKLAQTLPGVFWDEFGVRASKWSRKKSQVVRDSQEENLRQMIRDYSQNTAAQSEHFDWHFTGHVHVKDEFQFSHNNKTIHSVNLGSWFQKPQAYKLTDAKGEWVDL